MNEEWPKWPPDEVACFVCSKVGKTADYFYTDEMEESDGDDVFVCPTCFWRDDEPTDQTSDKHSL